MGLIAAPKTGELDRQTQEATAYWSRDSPAEINEGSRAQCKICTITDQSLQAPCGQV